MVQDPGFGKPIGMNWRTRMKRRRRELGLTQEQLAAKLDIDQTTISDWERGKREPNLETFEALAKALDVHLAYLITDIDPADLEAARVKRMLHGIPKQERDHYIGLLESRSTASET